MVIDKDTSDSNTLNRIIASDFTALKTRVKNEMNRRNGTGSLTTFGSTTYDYTTTPAAGVTIKKEHYTKLQVPLNNLVYTINASLGDGTKIVEQSDVTLFDSALDSAEARNRYTQSISSSYSYYGSTDCKSSCSGTCTNACVGLCVGCSGSCTGGCTGCGTSCSYNCSTTCTGDCTAVCSMDCSGGCRDGCYTGCTGSCTGGCTGGCGTSCSTNCSTTCEGLCDADCAAGN